MNISESYSEYCNKFVQMFSCFRNFRSWRMDVLVGSALQSFQSSYYAIRVPSSRHLTQLAPPDGSSDGYSLRSSFSKAIKWAQKEGAAPIVIVPERYWLSHFFVFYRKRNSFIQRDSHLTPRMNDCVDSLQDSSITSPPDTDRRCWQLNIEDEDQEKFFLPLTTA